MIENTKQNIKDWFFSVFNTSYQGKFNSYCYDFTQKEIKPDLFSQSQYPFNDLLSSFDYVIGNPPLLIKSIILVGVPISGLLSFCDNLKD